MRLVVLVLELEGGHTATRKIVGYGETVPDALRHLADAYETGGVVEQSPGGSENTTPLTP